MPRRTLRIRVGGLVLAVEAERPTPALDPPPALVPFLAARGADVRLRYREAPPSEVQGERLFASAGVWDVERDRGRLVYSFRARGRRPALYKQVTIDTALKRGTLHFDASPRGPHYALDYPLDELLFQHRLAREGALEVHACGVVWRGRTLLFCGRSGAGKSTTARLWSRHARGARLLSDDRVVLRPGKRSVRAYGTPWHGDGGFASPASAPLGALFFLRHGRRTRLRPLGTAEAAARLFTRSFPPPWDRVGVARVLDACADTAFRVPAFELAFRPRREAVTAVMQCVR
ncbi:MAG TPA: hypothetical protein VIJ10_01200 [Vicinamibacteria bacterium]